MRALGGPRRYVQGPGALQVAGGLIAELGRYPFCLLDSAVYPALEGQLTEGLAGAGLVATLARFSGECCWQEIDRLTAMAVSQRCDIVVGVGGGKTADTAKAVALKLGMPVCIVPTISSTDAPASRLIVVRTPAGVVEKVECLEFNPDLVLVDTAIIAAAPERFLVAGMGDALCTKFEAEQCYASGRSNLFGARPTHTALALADACYRIVREYGPAARAAVSRACTDEALEAVVEASILLSGLGYESGGLAAAHALNHGFSEIPELHRALHGECVAFGLLVQLVLEGRDEAFILDMVAFYRTLGLPCTLRDLGLASPTTEQIATIARRTCRPGSYIYNMAVPIDEAGIVDAIQTANTLGRWAETS